MKSPEISPEIEKKYPGHAVISIDGKVIGIGKDTQIALENAKKKIPDIRDRVFMMSHIPSGFPRV